MRFFTSFLTIFLLLTSSLVLPAKAKEDPSKEVAGAPPATSAQQDEALLKQISRGFSRVAKAATPAVVYIETEATAKESSREPSTRKKGGKPYENPFDYFQDEFFNRFFGFPYQEEPRKQTETVRGSGFFVSSDGFIMTNNHVVENAKKITITTSNGKKYTATVVGTDPKTDLAIIKVDEKNFPYLKFGNSDELEVGDWAIAIGNPFGLQASLTVGVVSAKGRNDLHITDFDDFIQTDAAINPGNSGGPLLDVDGNVIGINTAIVSGGGGYLGIGFAIPSNMADRIKDQLVKKGSVTRGYLGVTLQPIDQELATYYKLDLMQGALVAEVSEGSPAANAGLKQEDIILSYNGVVIDSLNAFRAFRNTISLMDPGSKVHLEVLRDGKKIPVDVVISALPDEVSIVQTALKKLGLDVKDLTPAMAKQLGLPDEKAVVITRVDAGTPAAEAGLRPGIMIVAVNRQRIFSVQEFEEVLQNTPEGTPLLLMVRQGDTVRFVALTMM